MVKERRPRTTLLGRWEEIRQTQDDVKLQTMAKYQDSVPDPVHTTEPQLYHKELNDTAEVRQLKSEMTDRCLLHFLHKKVSRETV